MQRNRKATRGTQRHIQRCWEVQRGIRKYSETQVGMGVWGGVGRHKVCDGTGEA